MHNTQINYILYIFIAKAQVQYYNLISINIDRYAQI